MGSRQFTLQYGQLEVSQSQPAWATWSSCAKKPKGEAAAQESAAQCLQALGSNSSTGKKQTTKNMGQKKKKKRGREGP